MERGEPPPNQSSVSEGRVAGLINSVKGLTITNVLVILMLAVIVGPAYILYRALNDEALLDRFLSTYRAIPTSTNCTVREVGERTSNNFWVIAAGFAYQGTDRWQVAVVLDQRPDAGKETSYCETLKLIVERMRDPDIPTPTFPGTDEPIIHQYAPKTPPDGYGGPR
jgi:hypothetical protein